jgi:hypothetical protein
LRALLLQLDGKLPNIALMRIAAHHRERGDDVAFRVVGNMQGVERQLWDEPDQVYASLIFKRSRPLAERLKHVYPDAHIGGSGWDVIPDSLGGLVSIASRRQSAEVSSLERIGITTKRKDYSLYPNFPHSVGFTQRGCRMGCGFCDVPVKEGKVLADEMIADIWRGDPWPKNLILWDNDTFGNSGWRDVFAAIRDGGFRVSFNQGINARLMNEENAEALASMPCYDDQFKTRRIYTAWDNRDDEEILFRGLNALVKYGAKPDWIMVYMLIGYWPGETHEGRDYRRMRLRDFGARPYPMPFVRTPELVGFQRWVIGAYDKRVSWADWQAAKYEPRNLGGRAA